MADKWRRKHEPKHVRIYASITKTEAWKHLSGNSVKVLLALCERDNGSRNGAISFSVREAAEGCGLSIPTAKRCLEELQEKGFIRCTQKGSFSRKVLHASLWRVTWVAWPGGRPAAPTRDFEKWAPDGNTRCKNFRPSVQVSSIEAETNGASVQETYTANPANPHVSISQSNKETCTHTIYQGDSLSTLGMEQRKQANNHEGENLGLLRTRLTEHLTDAEPGEQTRLCDSLKIPPGTMSKFIHGANLPKPYRSPLERTLG